jgi:hypothetical protein
MFKYLINSKIYSNIYRNKRVNVMLNLPKFVNELYYETGIIKMFRGSLIYVKMLFYISTAPCPVSIYVYTLNSTSDKV